MDEVNILIVFKNGNIVRFPRMTDWGFTAKDRAYVQRDVKNAFLDLSDAIYFGPEDFWEEREQDNKVKYVYK